MSTPEEYSADGISEFESYDLNSLDSELREMIEKHITNGHIVVGVFVGHIKDIGEDGYLVQYADRRDIDEIDEIVVSAELIKSSNDPQAEVGRIFDCVSYTEITDSEAKSELLFREPREFTEEEKAQIEQRAQELLKVMGHASDGPIL